MKRFEVGQEYRKVGFYGGVTVYTVKEIDRENCKILLAENWFDVDGEGTRPAEWHKLEIDNKENERALEWESDKYGAFWIEAIGNDNTTETECKRKCKECGRYFKDPHNLCYLAEIDEVNGDTDACENFEKSYDEDEYCPSATNGDYSPSNPWDASGMSIRDFI